MAIKLKCERCYKFYNSYSGVYAPKYDQRFNVVYLRGPDGPKGTNLYDGIGFYLCEDCMTKMINFLIPEASEFPEEGAEMEVDE